MHSSRMRTARLLPVSPSMHCSRGTWPGGGTWSRRGVPGPGGMYPVPAGFPLRLEKPEKPAKMGRHFPVREKSGNFEQTGKVRENHTKYWKNIREFQKNVMLFFSDI